MRLSQLLAPFFISVVVASAHAADKESNMTITSNMRPWCFGHFMLDRPEHSEVSAQHFAYDGYSIETVRNVSNAMFASRVAAREQELRAKTRDDPTRSGAAFHTNVPWLERIDAIAPNARSLSFAGIQAEGNDAMFNVEAYVHDQTTLYILKTKAERQYVNNKLVSRDGGLFTSIRYRDNWTVPTEKGFCFDGGLIGGNQRTSEDVVQTFALDPDKAAMLNVTIREALDADARTSLSTGELRSKLDRAGVGASVTILRESKRQIAGMEAQEVLLSIGEGSTHLYRFYLLAPGKPGSIASPHMAVEMALGDVSSGGKLTAQNASPLDPASAMAAWDKLVGTIRLRPGAL